MRRPLLTLLVLLVVLAGCAQAGQIADDARAAVDEARGQVDELTARAEQVRDRFAWCGAAVRLGTAAAERDATAARRAADELRADAPAELEDDLETIVAAAADVEAGEQEALLDADVQDAARVVLDTAIDECGVTGG